MRDTLIHSGFTLLAPFLVALSFALVSRDSTIGIAGADDAYFYLVVARNAAHGCVSSFDGMSLTNGYHPLWAALVTPIFVLVDSKDTALSIVLLAGCALNGITLRVIWRVLDRRVSPEAARFGAAFFVLFAMVPAWYIGEAPLAMLTFALFSERLLRVALDPPGSGSSRSEGATLGLFAAAVALARLDAVMPVFAGLAWLWFAARGVTRGSATGALVVFGVALGLYVVSNCILHGNPIPISGVLKSSFPYLSLINYPLTSLKWYRLLLPLVMALLFVAWRSAGGRTWAGNALAVDRPLAALALGSVAFFVYEALFQKDADFGLYSWHFAVATCLSALLVGRLCNVIDFFRRARWTSAILLAVGLFSCAYRYALASNVDATLSDAHYLGRWIDENLPKSAVIAAADSGMLAYFGDRPTVNLDGLINNFEYQDVLLRKDLRGYLDGKGVTHVVVRDRAAAVMTQEELALFLPSRLYPGAGDAIVVYSRHCLCTAPNRTAALFERAPRAAVPR
jgi:hypothetical protein